MAPPALALAVLLVTSMAGAQTHGVAPAGGGLTALDVSVALADGTVVANGARIPIGLDRARLPSEAEVKVETIAIGEGKHVVHVSVPARDSDDVAWEALLAAGRREPLFSGLTGFGAGDPGERIGKEVTVVPSSSGATSFVLVSDIREDLRICGQRATMLDPQALYPASLDFHSTTAQRLPAEQREAAQRVLATDAGPARAPALARLLVSRGSSVPDSRGAELTDGDPTTVWSERRPGMGQGEFVVMAAPKDVPVSRMQMIVAPASSPRTEGAAPRTFYLVTETETFEVTLPTDAWLKPGEAYEIAFPRPIEASCVALVLSDAYTRGMAHPVVSVAELVAYSEFDRPGATLDDVARSLTGPRGIAAAAVLERAGAKALEAVRAAYGALDARGRALAVDVAASHDSCVEAAPLLAEALCEMAGEAPRKAREKLERCKGATGALATAMEKEPSRRACIAPTLAVLAGADALGPIANGMGAADSDAETRAVLRSAFAEALDAAPPGRLAALLADAGRGPAARLEILRAAGSRVAEAPAESEQALAAIFQQSSPLRLRYLALGPIGELARTGDTAATARVADLITHDIDWPVRERAAELGAGLPMAQSALVSATRDPEPRVREAALQSLAASLPSGAVDAAREALERDGWSFVRTQAVGVLSRAPASPQVDDALRMAMGDHAGRVRAAALVAVAIRHTAALHAAVRERLEDGDEDADVRAAAAAALGALCDVSSAARLTDLARELASPVASEDDQQIALGALVGLAALQPHDLKARLAPLLAQSAPPTVRAAAQKALSAQGTCR